MIVTFHISYKTKWGELLCLQLRREKKSEIVFCQSHDGLNWHASIETNNKAHISYKYMIKAGGSISTEHGEFRRLLLPGRSGHVFINDYWRPRNDFRQVFFSAAFKDVIFRRKRVAPGDKKLKTGIENTVVFQLHAAAIPPRLQVGIVGNIDELGNWKTPVILSDRAFPIWRTAIDIPDAGVDIAYKYVWYDSAKNMIVKWEQGENRRMLFTLPSDSGNTLVQTDEYFRSEFQWRGAGLAIPVFSLRSSQGLGIGEYNDIRLLVDWAAATGMKLVQVLPVNDTIGSKTWKDSYPYRAISVFALHPLYVNLGSIAKLKDARAAKRLQKLTAELNKPEHIDFEKVLKTKLEYLRLIYEQEKKDFLENEDFQTFLISNASWLKPYAAFCFLRDHYGTVNFNEWKDYASYTPQKVDQLCNPASTDFEEIAFHYFVQYHAHLQLTAATEYARKKSVVLKGDLPIGIGRYSCDAWVAPELYNMDGQAGAPPDFYSEEGQNWGFPTYNWNEMAKDGFDWWRRRMTKLAQYFDALRIDHILGFFRIWQIPTDQVLGTMGLFNPRLPYSRSELSASFGLHGNFDRYTKPYIRAHILREMFGEEEAFVRDGFTRELTPGFFTLKEEVNTQRKIIDRFNGDPELAGKTHLLKPLMKLVSEVLLIEEPGSHGTAYNPRITLNTTRSFEELDAAGQQVFTRLYNDYFFSRHDGFWRKQALWKLPALLDATNMLICGEDLGMIPASVPGVMEALNILTLEIQRMPKGQEDFGIPSAYPYTSVCSPSCHDMATVRGWWEEDHERSSRFFTQQVDPYQPAPQEGTPGLVEFINRQHLASPSMWAIFPLQDLLGMDEDLRRSDASSEQINDPGNPEHYWRYRFHLPLEQLVEKDDFNEKIRMMVKLSGR